MSSNLVITHADSGLVHARVERAERISPHFMRVTIGGEDVQRFTWQGFDQWVRLAIPVADTAGLQRMPDTFGVKGWLRYLTVPKGIRPVVRNYTLRDWRADAGELDIDFVVHGTDGVAGPWAAAATRGDELAFIDQGCGWRGLRSDWSLLVADESGLPAVAGILRDLPRDATGHAIVEIPDEADRQDLQAPSGVEVHWLTRAAGSTPSEAALETLQALEFPDGTPYAFVVGERALATGGRRHLVNDRGVAKEQVTFSGYWRLGKHG